MLFGFDLHFGISLQPLAGFEDAADEVNGFGHFIFESPEEGCGARTTEGCGEADAPALDATDAEDDGKAAGALGAESELIGGGASASADTLGGGGAAEIALPRASSFSAFGAGEPPRRRTKITTHAPMRVAIIATRAINACFPCFFFGSPSAGREGAPCVRGAGGAADAGARTIGAVEVVAPAPPPEAARYAATTPAPSSSFKVPPKARGIDAGALEMGDGALEIGGGALKGGTELSRA